MRISTIIISLILYNLSHAETLTIAISPFTPPFVIATDENNHYIGFSIEIMETICKQLEVTCDYKPMSFNSAFRAVINKQTDLAIGIIFITRSREDRVLFSLPYLPSAMRFITMSDNPVETIEGLRGKTIGAAKGGRVSEELIYSKLGVDTTIKSYPLFAEMMLALANGDVDAIITDEAIAETWYANNGSMFKLLGNEIPAGQGYGIMTSKTNTSLMDKVNNAILKMQSDGTYLNIYNTYFGVLGA